MRITFKNFLLVFLALVFSAQSILATHAESNFWRERRKIFEKKDPNDHAVQLASLPAPRLTAQSLIKELPTLRPTLPQVAKWNTPNKKTSKYNSPHLQNILNAIPFVYGAVQEVYEAKGVPSAKFKVQSSF